ncbi:MAG: EAL and GGDEF domain-containing protein [Oscillospiraceae bacterium]|nr:EAL and GGDEF domain-containing protein [Oscillospiraceae bacterium]
MGRRKPKGGSDNMMKEQFLSILENKQIETVFQPIVSLRDGSVYGYEALSRGPVNTEMYYPTILFDCAEKYDKAWELELLCRMKAIETVHAMNAKFRLFLNVNPKVIHDEKFKQGFTKEYLAQNGINPEDVIFEITERGVVSNVSDFIATIDNYKNQNYRIAIDDAGAGYSGLNMITDIHPHFIKLDMNLIRDIDKDATKQSLVRSFTEFASLTNTYLIAEGIETKQELLKLIEIGVHYGQGFYLQTPNCVVSPLDNSVLSTINEANEKKNHLLDKVSSEIYICNVSTPQKSINSKILVSQVFDLMEKDRSISGLCVTEDGYVTGTITRNELYRRLSFQYGYSLYSNKAIETIMSRVFLRVDYHDSIETVANKAMSRDYDQMYDIVTVTMDDKYFGIVTVKDLLEKALQIGVSNARHLNPLSALPGNVLIEKQLENCINSNLDYSVLYFDLNNFKAYNDVYGFENGDKIIKCTTKILKNNISEEAGFIGHIGGDDFMAIVDTQNAEALCKSIIEEFDEDVKEYYSTNDLKRGCITTKNRHGIEEDFPILSIAIAAVSSKKYDTIFKLSEDMAKLKKLCKQSPGSNYLFG